MRDERNARPNGLCLGQIRVVRGEGRVQGVGYRVNARREAERLGIDATPVNLDDGTVRIVVAGPREAVDAIRNPETEATPETTPTPDGQIPAQAAGEGSESTPEG